MKVLITGISGFIGHHVADKFSGLDYEIVGIDNEKKDCIFRTYVIDLLKDDIAIVLKSEKPDIIIHCAGLASVPYSFAHPEEDIQLNTVMVQRILFAMKECNMGNIRFIMLSSAAVYGQPMHLPVCETDELNPMSPYALHKKMAEDICLYFIRNFDFDIKIARIFSAYGPGLKKQIFWDMLQKINNDGQLNLFGTGNESRDYIFIEDIVEAIYLIAVNDTLNYIFWNVANGQEIFIKDLARLFVQKKKIPYNKIVFNGSIREGDPLNWCADISRLALIGYKRQVSIEEGIDRYIRWAERL